MKNLKSGALIAIAAGGLFASACKKEEKAGTQPAVEPAKAETPPPTPPPAEAKPAEAGSAAVANPEKISKVDCGGVNACKGQGTCKTEKHGCGGQNECKGQGVVTMSEEDCKAKGGTVTAQK